MMIMKVWLYKEEMERRAVQSPENLWEIVLDQNEQQRPHESV